MYKKNRIAISSMIYNNSVEGSTLEQKIERIINNKETITDGAPIIFTEKSEGVNAAYNIRTDRWEIALDGIDKIEKSRQAKREEKAKMEVVKDDKIEPTQGTENQQITK